MKRKLLFSIPMLFALVLFFSIDGKAQGFENFDNLDLSGTAYQDGTFEGQDGSTWTFWQCRGDVEIDGNAIMIGRNRTPQSNFYSGAIEGGVGIINFDYMQAFGTNVNLNVLVNGLVVGNVTSDGEQNVVKNSGDIVVNIPGEVEIKFINVNNGDGQVVVDNILWTGYEAEGPYVLNVTATPDWQTQSLSITGIIGGDDEGEIEEVSIGALRWVDENDYPDHVLGHQAFMLEVVDGEFSIVLTEGEPWPGGESWHGLQPGTHQIRAAIVDDGAIVDFQDSNEFTYVPVVEVATLLELRDMEVDGTIYHFSGEAVIVAMDGFRNRKFIQDETAAILIFDQPGVITTEYELYDVITDVFGKLSVVNDMLRFEPELNTAEATLNTPVEPVLFGLDEVTSDDQAKLVHFENVSFVNINEGQTFANGTNYTITDGEEEFVLRTDFWNVDYTGELIPHTPVNISGVILQFNQILQIVPRFAADFDVPLQPAEPLELFTWMDTTGENIPPELGTGNNARAAALCMNRYVVVPSREGGNNVWVWDSHNPDDPPVALNPGDGYVSGLFVINYVRAVGGHIYVSNMTLGTNNWHPFKVYRWAGIDAEPEVIINLTYNVDDPAMNWGRLGDAFSIIGDPADEGSIIAHVASGGDGNRNYLKWNFVDGVNQNPQEPELITVDATFNINSYGSFNPIEGEDELFLVTGNTMGIALVDLDGEVHSYLGTDIIPMRSMDPRVFYYDGNRYLSYVVSNEADAESGAYYDVIDISMGDNVLEAFASITTLEDLNLRRAHSSVLGAGNAFYSSTHNVSHTEDGDVVFLSYVLGRGFILESSVELEIEEPIDLPFDILFNQPYHDGGTAAASVYDSGGEELINYIVADNFFDVDQEIEEFVFYGLALKLIDGVWTEQVPGETEPFFVRFYEYEEDISVGLLAPVTGVYQIALIDDWGDGWNGGEVTVYVNGVAVLTDLTLPSGAGPEYHEFSAEEGDEISTSYTPGSWAYENYYAILDPDGNIIAEDGGTWDNPGASTPEGIEPGGEVIALEPDWDNPADDFYGDFDVEHVGAVWNGAYQLYKFSASFETPVNMEEGWISAQIDADNGSGTWFLWLNSLAGDMQAWQHDAGAEKIQFNRDMPDLSGVSQKGNVHSTRSELEYDLAFELWGGEITSAPLCAGDPMPADEATGVPIDGYLGWTGDPITDGYLLYFGLEGGEWEIADGVDLGDVSNFAFEGLVYSTTYEWKVVPYNVLGEAEDCPTWSFTTMLDPLQQIPWEENFDDLANGTLPDFWQRTHTNWGAWNTNNAGGESAPELRFNWSPSSTDTFKAITPPIDSGDAESFGLTFMHSVNDYSGGYELKVQVSTDEGETWEDRWVLEIESKKDVPVKREDSNKGNVPPTMVALNLSDLAGEIFHLAFVYEGNSFNINQWYIDDIVVDEMEFFTLTFDVVGAFHGFEIDDATITLDGVEYEPGHYVFEDLIEGTYAYTVSKLCYEDVVDVVTITENTVVEIELDLDLLPGDANGDGVVNTLDLIAIGNYYLGNDPVDFCFHNADVNEDGEVDVLDIIGVVNIFAKGQIAPHDGLHSNAANIFMDKNGIWIDSDGTLAGLQFELTGNIADLLLELELKTNHEIIFVNSGGVLKAMIFSLDNTAIPSGKQALVSFSSEAEVEWLSAKAGNLNAEEVPLTTHSDEVTDVADVSELGFKAYPNPASDVLYVEFYNSDQARISLVNVQGQIVQSHIVSETGPQQISFNTGQLPGGIYMLHVQHADTSFTERILIK